MAAGRPTRPLMTMNSAVCFTTVMNRGAVFSSVLFVLLATFSVPAVQAQTVEAGLQVTAVRLQRIGESPVGLGARVLLHLNDRVALDIEGDYFPENPSGNFGQATAMAGVRAGSRFEKFGFFAKARPGIVHFGGAFYDLRMADRTHFLLDIGGVLEYYPSPRIVLRVDLGDMIIAYGSTRLLTVLNPAPLGTTHNFHSGFGVSFRF